MKESVFTQAMKKGGRFTFVFYLFFMMSFIPITLFFFLSLAQGNLPGMTLALIFTAVLLSDIKRKKLYALCRDMAILNLTLWFILGFFTFIQQILVKAPAYLAYLLLAPYALISGYLVYFLLSRSTRKKEQVLAGGIAVSTMIAIISAISTALLDALKVITNQAQQAIPGNGTVMLIEKVTPNFHNHHLAFLLLFVLFNIPFIRYHFKKKGKKRTLIFYLIPIAAYIIIYIAWNLSKTAILG